MWHVLRLSLFLVLGMNSSYCDSTEIRKPLKIISDIDDTLMITHVENQLDAISNFLKRPKPFFGMSELFSEILNNHENSDFNYVSGSAKFLRIRIEKFILMNHFPIGEFFLTNTNEWFNQKTLEFKLRTLEVLLKENKKEVLLFGDNTQFDPFVYLETLKKFPEQVQSIYIHSISQSTLDDPSPDLFYYITPIEVAVNEFNKNRMSEKSLGQIVDSFIKMSQEELMSVIPMWGFCPKALVELPKVYQDAYLAGTWGPFLMELRQISGKLIQGCMTRQPFSLESIPPDPVP